MQFQVFLVLFFALVASVTSAPTPGEGNEGNNELWQGPVDDALDTAPKPIRCQHLRSVTTFKLNIEKKQDDEIYAVPFVS
ncbi:uncharacterized protein ARMOST_08350 [Armillaria ostoyae]|uniref:Uncharacterized protein n=1 Tax=Armillaria ostoyae TaxID=47428 RepID=A0A284R8F7_ARMOS|nr:uncharacterized protein ARMOST_08350 [Armillaria ostoyae]